MTDEEFTDVQINDRHSELAWACRCCCAVLPADEPRPRRCLRCGDEVRLVSLSFAEAIAEIDVADTPLLGPEVEIDH